MIGLASWWVLLLLPLPILAWQLLPPRPERGAVRVPTSVLARLQEQSGARSAERRLPTGLLLSVVGWVALVVALAGPFSRQPELLKPTGRDIVVALDLSASMAETDMTMADRKVARIAVIRDRLATFLKGRRGDRVALIGFATDAYLIAPLTFDVHAIAEMLDEATIGMPGRKTDLGQAIGLTVKMLRDEPRGERLLLLISDGETNAGELAALDAARLAQRLDLRIVTVGFASEIDSANAAHMAELAQMTGGSFHAATNPKLMQAVYDDLNRLAPIIPENNAVERRRDLRWIAIMVALSCLVGIGWREARTA
ncbi:MAG: VWA domain-containing protein [Paracoccaceae bacterium]